MNIQKSINKLNQLEYFLNNAEDYIVCDIKMVIIFLCESFKKIKSVRINGISCKLEWGSFRKVTDELHHYIKLQGIWGITLVKKSSSFLD